MRWLPAILSLLIMIAGWHYTFYSRAAHRLSGVEAHPANRRRVGLRRAGGILMLLLGLGIAMGVYWADPHDRPVAFVWIWASVAGLLVGTIVLAMLDIRLTWQLRKNPPKDVS